MNLNEIALRIAVQVYEGKPDQAGREYLLHLRNLVPVCCWRREM